MKQWKGIIDSKLDTNILQKALYFLFISAFLITLFSWFRYLIVENPAPDHAFLPFPFNLSGILILLASISMALIGQLLIVKQINVYGLNEYHKQILLSVGILLALISTFMLPLLSNDIFSYLSYVDLFVNTDVNPYTLSGAGLKTSKYYSLIGSTWKNTPFCYGPFQLIFWVPAVLISGNNLFVAIAIFKVLVLGLVIGTILLLYRYATSPEINKKNDVMLFTVILSPILWIEGAGQAHNDILIAFLYAAWLNLASKKQFFLSGIMVGLALASKLTSLVPGIMFVLYLMRRVSFLKGVSAGFTILIIVVLMYVPVWNGIETLTIPFNALAHGDMTNSLWQVFYNIAKIFKAEQSNIIHNLFYIRMISGVTIALAGAYLSLRSLTFQDLLGAMVKIYVLISMVALPFYHPWYLLPCLILALELREPIWQKWFLVVSTTGILLDGSVLLAKGSFERNVYVAITVTVQSIFVLYLIFRLIPKWYSRDNL